MPNHGPQWHQKPDTILTEMEAVATPTLELVWLSPVVDSTLMEKLLRQPHTLLMGLPEMVPHPIFRPRAFPSFHTWWCLTTLPWVPQQLIYVHSKLTSAQIQQLIPCPTPQHMEHSRAGESDSNDNLCRSRLRILTSRNQWLCSLRLQSSALSLADPCQLRDFSELAYVPYPHSFLLLLSFFL